MSTDSLSPSWKTLEIPDHAKAGIISIGNFDGVHLGHRSLINQMQSLGNEHQAPIVPITFFPHPLLQLKPNIKLNFLSTIEQKKKLLNSEGVAFVAVLKTDDGLLDLSAEDFFEKIIVRKFKAKGIIEGPDFQFGKGRNGTMALLQQLCLANNILFHTAQPMLLGNTLISSSKIRNAIQTGDLQAAKSLLGRFYSIEGSVVTGAKRGRTIGFPTANLENIQTILPANGVYAGLCKIGAKTFTTALNIGPNPTFAETLQKVEAHLLDFEGDLYNQCLEILFIEKIRDTKAFLNKEELVNQIQFDISKIREITSHFKN